MKRRSLAIAWVLTAALAAAIPAGCSRREGGRPSGESAEAARYHCPMHPQIVSDKPGECPICFMNLVPIAEDGAAHHAAGDAAGSGEGPEGYAPIRVDSLARGLIGVRLEAVRMGPFATEIRAPGRVTFDETRVHHVHTRYEGYVEEVRADFVGKTVRAGEPIATIYSPEVQATAEEFLMALSASRATADVPRATVELAEAARRRLLLWEVSPEQIDLMARSGKPVHAVELKAPITGVVIGKTAYHGMKVVPEDALFDLADLTRVWVLADLYESELTRVAVGHDARMTLPYRPGRTWSGRVTYIFPTVDETTRTVKVRLEFDNPEGELKPGMLADVFLSSAFRVALLVSEDAVLDSGVRKIAFVWRGDGRLEPREIVTGDHAEGVYEVLSGLAEGDTVAAGANFLLDSESRIRSAISSAAHGGAH